MSLLTHLGFEEVKKGKTAGSRVKFVNINYEDYVIILHKPPPNNIIKAYQLREILLVIEEVLEK